MHIVGISIKASHRKQRSGTKRSRDYALTRIYVKQYLCWLQKADHYLNGSKTSTVFAHRLGIQILNLHSNPDPLLLRRRIHAPLFSYRNLSISALGDEMNVSL